MSEFRQLTPFKYINSSRFQSQAHPCVQPHPPSGVQYTSSSAHWPRTYVINDYKWRLLPYTHPGCHCKTASDDVFISHRSQFHSVQFPQFNCCGSLLLTLEPSREGTKSTFDRVKRDTKYRKPSTLTNNWAIVHLKVKSALHTNEIPLQVTRESRVALIKNHNYAHHLLWVFK